MSDPQFGIFHILRPFVGFEAVYQGKTASKPIMFAEGDNALDPNAGKPGYSPKLLAGLAVPMGARVKFWLPSFPAITATLQVIPYKWEITCRLRNVFDFRQRRVSYHYPKQGPGVPDTTVPASPARVIIPASTTTVLYSADRPPTVDTKAEAQIRSQIVLTDFPKVEQPFIPSGALGEYQQGILDPATSPAIASVPSYQRFEIQADGDEILIGAFRATNISATWDFGPLGADSVFSLEFGNGSGVQYPDIGVYVSSGESTAEFMPRSDNRGP